MTVNQQTKNQKGPNVQALGFKSPLEIIDLLALLKINGEPIINDERILLDSNLKTQAVMKYFLKNFDIKPNDLPYLASLIKHDLKNGKIGWRKR